jgi:hypothetical protein
MKSVKKDEYDVKKAIESVAKLEHDQCRFILETSEYCYNKKEEKRSYCKDHMKKVYVKVKKLTLR